MAQQAPTPEEVKKFEQAYADLCKEHKLAFVTVPQWKQSQDTGTFSMVLTLMVSRVPEAQ